MAERFPESVLISGKRLERSRIESDMRKRLLETLEAGPLTVPEVAERLEADIQDVMWWMMSCWRYGYIEPEGRADADGYFRYRLVEKD